MKWLAPFTKEELKMRGIVDMIYDLSHLITLYPDTPKTSFPRSVSVTSADGYVSVKLVAQIPDYVTPIVPVQNPEDADCSLPFDVDDVDMFLENILKESVNVSLPPDEEFQ